MLSTLNKFRKEHDRLLGIIGTIIILSILTYHIIKDTLDLRNNGKYTIGKVLNPTSSVNHKYVYVVNGVKYYGTVREHASLQKRNHIKYGDKFWVVYSSKHPTKSVLLKHRKYTKETKFPDEVIKEDLTWFRLFSY